MPQDVPTGDNSIRASRVQGTKVYNAAGEHLGHIDDLVINKRSGKTEVALMSFGGFLGIGERYHPLPWNSLTYEPSQGGYVVNLSREQLENAPSYGTSDEPDWNDRAYNERIYTYYGYPYI
jgi:sporulation protein YlmC with PRC-barrel domain